MFTGIVTHTGRVYQALPTNTGLRLGVSHAMGPLSLGASVSVSGVCLTVTSQTDDRLAVDVSSETIKVTTLASLPEGAKVNLERALVVGDELGGHWVSGHVDGVAEVTSVMKEGDALDVVLRVPHDLMPLLAAKGSVALDGVSLTVNETLGDSIRVKLIPHTLRETTLAELAVERKLNLEVDLLARYVSRILSMVSQKKGVP